MPRFGRLMNLQELEAADDARVALSRMAPKDTAKRIHAENRKYAPDTEKNTVLCHIIADSILPDAQKAEGILNRLSSGTRGKDYSYEKMVELKVRASEDFVKQVQTAIESAEKSHRKEYGDDYAKYTFVYDVACPDIATVIKVRERLNLPALAFSSKSGNVVQVEGIPMALRALRSGNVVRLRDAYKTLGGKESVDDITDTDDFAIRITFSLPAAEVADYRDRERINRLIQENVMDAA